MPPTKYADVYYREYCDILTKTFRTYFEKELYIDLIFLCKYNKKAGAHQLVLGSFSTLLHELLSEHQLRFKGHVAYVCVPDIRIRHMNHILKFIYYGKVTLKTQDELTSLYQNLELLDLPSKIVTSDSESFCIFISGDRNSKHDSKCSELDAPSDIVRKENDDGIIGKNTMISIQEDKELVVNAEETECSNSLHVITNNGDTLEPNVIIDHGGAEQNEMELTSHGENANSCTINLGTEPQISSTANGTADLAQHAKQSVDSTNNAHFVINDQPSLPKEKVDLMTVLKNVAVACQDLESVGISDDENTRRHLQSCIRIVKQCVTDINDLLSTEVVSSSSENYKSTEKDWELKIMLENCLQHLPRLEKVIESFASGSRRRRRREKLDTVPIKSHSPKKN